MVGAPALCWLFYPSIPQQGTGALGPTSLVIVHKLTLTVAGLII